ncbi:MAG: energy transducer TonB [Balneolaceae bacterium]|nr:energy transducer TonB [Balneolaceae bacterium]
MPIIRKKPRYDLRKYYTILLETGIILVLVFLLAVVKVKFTQDTGNVDLTEEQEVVKMEEIVQTQHEETPPPPPRPAVPVEVPNDEIVEDQVLDINADLQLQDQLEMPPPPDESSEEEEDFFVVVEQMPKLKGGQEWLYSNIEYPDMARKAGIEGRVIVQFIINKNGEVENPRVIRGIGGGCDQAAIDVIKKAEFSPGRQRGKPVRVQMSQAIFFQLQN